MPDRLNQAPGHHALPRIGPGRTRWMGGWRPTRIKPVRERLTLIRVFEALRGLGYEWGYDAVGAMRDRAATLGGVCYD
jgi:hypothetical protein